MKLKDKILANKKAKKICPNCKHFEKIRTALYCNKADKFLLVEFIECNRDECCELLKDE